VHVDVVDTVGAGDAFTAAFLSTLATAADVLDSWDGLCAAPPDLAFGRAADRAAAASALTCAHAGALGPRANEVDELMRKEGRTRT
jgi:sugar/nucleoside kinase (ribokinase family)